MSFLPWSAICLTPNGRQGELFASQNPDGSIVFSLALKGEQAQSFLLVPPCMGRECPPGTPLARKRAPRRPNPDRVREPSRSACHLGVAEESRRLM